ncbi:uncharacterized protein KY384_006537 [Bacidia gigantensis]|uniref:uncharacterized protein n=1 Tax=Bacidia gigantensis TaxID=2732470 RepID=UPI001D040014|nr:uncharacterized protein KY384_006537 [Bacidia gigantensis]KAG8528848.1 hypothetical protein KY384_006537 [Bacidia gigantensis]
MVGSFRSAESASVQNRIQQWQAQGGGVVEVEEISSNDSGKEKKPAETLIADKQPNPTTPIPQKDSQLAYETPRANSRHKTRDRGTHEREIKIRSAPTKRVVSDGHWRKTRSPPKGELSSKLVGDEASTWSKWSKSERKSLAPVTDGNPSNEGDVLELHIHSTSPRLNDEDANRSYVTPPGSRRHSEIECKQHSASLCGTSVPDSPANDTARTPDRKSLRRTSANTDKHSHAGSSATKQMCEHRRFSPHSVKEVDHVTLPARSVRRGSLRSEKGNLLSQVFSDSRKMFAKHTPEPIVSPRVPSIEAWLDSTSDPFIDAEAPVEAVAPLRPSRKNKIPNSLGSTADDPNNIWETLSTNLTTQGTGLRGPVRKREFDLIPESGPDRPVDLPPDVPSSDPIRISNLDHARLGSPEASIEPLRRRVARKSVSSPIHNRRRSQKSSPLAGMEDRTSKSNSDAPSADDLDKKPSFKPPPLNIKRQFPSTGQHRLSTIASVDTLQTTSEIITHPLPISTKEAINGARECNDALWKEVANANLPNRSNSRLTKHSDLISVLSMPVAGNGGIKSARSLRTNRTDLEATNVDELMQELMMDESKYVRELQTLVDGVIPVLINCVLSKSDSAVAAGLFQVSANAQGNPDFIRPIIDMGIALERLRTIHRKIPQKDPRSLLAWARGAQRVYNEYLRAWRLGFQDVVVNLATASASSPESSNQEGLNEGLPRDENGNVIDGDGEKVDVAFLLKRPLVRLKYLAKTLKGINITCPSSEAAGLAAKYQELVDAARQRVDEERARLEDEAAANIDATRSRDLRTLAPVSKVINKRGLRVRARDNFDLTLQHSSGQRIDCRVELLLRDEISEADEAGDVLICEVDESGRWLLFPPVPLEQISACSGEQNGELTVIIRGQSSDGSQWQEVFRLCSENEATNFEWIQMLGSEPLPAPIARASSFTEGEEKYKSSAGHLVPKPARNLEKSRTPSPAEVEIPIGERPTESSKRWSSHFNSQVPVAEYRHAGSNVAYGRVTTPSATGLSSLPSQSHQSPPAPSTPASRSPRTFKEALGLSGTSAMSGLRRTKAKRTSKHLDGSPRSPRSRTSRHEDDSYCSSPTSTDLDIGNENELVPLSAQTSIQNENDEVVEPEVMNAKTPDASLKRAPISSSADSLLNPKIRRERPADGLTQEVHLTETLRHSNDSLPTQVLRKGPLRLKQKSQIITPSPSVSGPESQGNARPDPANLSQAERSEPRARRSSSPLKHEYEPSTASDTPSDSDASIIEHHESASMTESSDEEDIEKHDVPTPLMPLGPFRNTMMKPSLVAKVPTPEGTLKPSDSASQAPYKTVPTQRQTAEKTIASIFSWSDQGSWESLHPDECSIVITPGLIEAFEMSASHSDSRPQSASAQKADVERLTDNASTVTSQNDDVQGERPLVALELTPLVPLRRGTAIDISIRSPPVSNCKLTSGNNIMFRSRSPEECEALYALINHSRIHNPTYIALQNARGPFGPGSSFPGPLGRGPTSQAGKSRSSWFGGFGRSSSYRASTKRTSSVAPSESSVGTMGTAFSALRRFGRGNGGGMFNIALSTITSRNGAGSGAGSVFSNSDNSSGSGAATPITPGMVANRDGSLGLKDAKIRLYIRETASKWRDMGSARLTILQPEKPGVGPDGRPLNGVHQKRILVTGKTKGETLLDAQLGESCFERVARTGIAVSVWEDVIGPNGEIGVAGAVGGVAGGRAKVYMVQMRSEAETAYTFSLVGKLRY